VLRTAEALGLGEHSFGIDLTREAIGEGGAGVAGQLPRVVLRVELVGTLSGNEGADRRISGGHDGINPLGLMPDATSAMGGAAATATVRITLV
jgi:hypothetical protein